MTCVLASIKLLRRLLSSWIGHLVQAGHGNSSLANAWAENASVAALPNEENPRLKVSW